MADMVCSGESLGRRSIQDELDATRSHVEPFAVLAPGPLRRLMDSQRVRFIPDGFNDVTAGVESSQVVLHLQY
jgi:hypothetical protein